MQDQVRILLLWTIDLKKCIVDQVLYMFYSVFVTEHGFFKYNVLMYKESSKLMLQFCLENLPSLVTRMQMANFFLIF